MAAHNMPGRLFMACPQVERKMGFAAIISLHAGILKMHTLPILLENGEALIDGNISKDLLCSTRPLDLDPIDFIPLAQTEVQAMAIIALVATAAVDFVNQVKISCNEPDFCPNRIAI
jgi:hypothetical protein